MRVHVHVSETRAYVRTNVHIADYDTQLLSDNVRDYAPTTPPGHASLLFTSLLLSPLQVLQSVPAAQLRRFVAARFVTTARFAPTWLQNVLKGSFTARVVTPSSPAPLCLPFSHDWCVGVWVWECGCVGVGVAVVLVCECMWVYMCV